MVFRYSKRARTFFTKNGSRYLKFRRARPQCVVLHTLVLMYSCCTRQASGMTCDSDVMEKPSRRWRGAIQQLADFV